MKKSAGFLILWFLLLGCRTVCIHPDIEVAKGRWDVHERRGEIFLDLFASDGNTIISGKAVDKTGKTVEISTSSKRNFVEGWRCNLGGPQNGCGGDSIEVRISQNVIVFPEYYDCGEDGWKLRLDRGRTYQLTASRQRLF